MLLIHTALFAEAKAFVDHFKLTCTQSKPHKIYQNDSIVLCVTGIGKQKSEQIEEIFLKYPIKKAFNIGIAGCKDKTIPLGTLFCTTHNLADVPRASISSVDMALDNAKKLSTLLVDMEAETFVSISEGHLPLDDILVMKIVSDHLDTTIPKKEFVWKIIDKNFSTIKKILTSQD